MWRTQLVRPNEYRQSLGCAGFNAGIAWQSVAFWVHLHNLCSHTMLVEKSEKGLDRDILVPQQPW